MKVMKVSQITVTTLEVAAPMVAMTVPSGVPPSTPALFWAALTAGIRRSATLPVVQLAREPPTPMAG